MSKAERAKIVARMKKLEKAVEVNDVDAAEKVIKFLVARARQLSSKENIKLAKLNNAVIEMARNKPKENKQ